MNDLLWPRVCASFLVDTGIATLCGLLLAERWTAAGIDDKHLRGVAKACAGVLCLTSCWQLTLLAITFSGESTFHAVLAILPDVLRTHAGAMLLAASVASALLLAAAWIVPRPLRSRVCAVLMLLFLALHGAVGHAAVDGIFSLAEGLQWVHLLSMALWSGGVLISGFLVMPMMMKRDGAQAEDIQRYLGALSTVSTVCVGLVLASGAVKGYRTTGGITLLGTSYWGRVLLLKLLAVMLTVGLGARNRWLLRRSTPWNQQAARRMAATLRAEAVCMVLVLVASAWLANSPLPTD